MAVQGSLSLGFEVTRPTHAKGTLASRVHTGEFFPKALCTPRVLRRVTAQSAFAPGPASKPGWFGKSPCMTRVMWRPRTGILSPRSCYTPSRPSRSFSLSAITGASTMTPGALLTRPRRIRLEASARESAWGRSVEPPAMNAALGHRVDSQESQTA